MCPFRPRFVRVIPMSLGLRLVAITWLVAPSGLCAQSLSFGALRPFVTGIVPVVGRNGAVGGVSVDALGVVANADRDTLGRLGRLLRESQPEIPDELSGPCALRKVSLRRIEEALATALMEGRPVPDAIQYVGGLTRIRYVFVYPDDNDIVLAGPAEGWTVDSRGNVVGVHSGRPILQLEDLLVAMRSVGSARTRGISCSINPTDEGVRNLQSFLSTQRQFRPAVVDAIEKILGPQTVSITGVPASSRFAHIMLASDFRMKRIAMKLDKSPVRGLASYLDLMRSGRTVAGNMMPRWWLACDYEPLAHSNDSLAWELRGPGVKTMTETDFLADDGAARPTGKKSSMAQKWADQMTAAYDELSQKEPVFGELRNLMDLSVVAALIAKEDLLTRAGCSLPHLMRTDSPLQIGLWNVPKRIATQCSLAKKGRRWIITASGGILIDSWYIAHRTTTSNTLTRTKAP